MQRKLGLAGYKDLEVTLQARSDEAVPIGTLMKGAESRRSRSFKNVKNKGRSRNLYI